MLKRNVLNKIFLLKLIHESDGISDITRLQKLVFSAEEYGRKYNTLTFNYNFIRWHEGPYSPEVTSDLELLIDSNFVSEDDDGYKITELGIETIDKVSEIHPLQNVEDMFQKVIQRYHNLSQEDLLAMVFKKYKIDSNYEKGEVILPVVDGQVGEYV